MAKSKIVKDLVLGNTDMSNVLLRAKLLFLSLENDSLIKWVNNEITGYSDEEHIPDYRIFRGSLVGSYIRLIPPRDCLKYDNHLIPLGKMSQDLQDIFLNVQIRQGADEMSILSTDKSGLESSILPDAIPLLTRAIGNPCIRILSAKVKIEPYWFANVLSSVRNRLLDSLLLLEDEFGNLDNLDIDTTSKRDSLEEIANRIYLIIYNDGRISIGNGNKFNNSSVVSSDVGYRNIFL